MEPESNPATNALEWSVSDLSGALKRTIEDQFGFVRVRGEISGYRGPSASGHVYFSLKDANAKIDAVIWKGVFGRLRIKPQEGLEIIATGKITTFPGKSSYQIIIDHIEPAGLGALMALLEERRRKLAAEGLFDEARKQLLPYLPEVIGVITSPTGAVIRDILHRLEDRFPRRVLVWPVRVQGETSGAEVAAAIRGFNALQPGGAIPRPDVLIVARGGGSLEDLMSFNDEAVVRAAAASAIPLISAVGHETDWTLIDYASDLRAPTPTGAAEKVVPVRSELMAMVDDLSRRRMAAMRRLFEQRRQALRAASRALPGRETLLNLPRQRLDLAATRLPAALRANALGFERRLSALSQRLQRRSPQVRLGMARERLAALTQRLIAARQATLREEKKRVGRERERLDQLLMRARRALATMASQRSARVAASAQLLDALSYTGVLKRGFALVRDAGGNPVRSKASALPGSALSVEFADGTVGVTVDGGTGPKPAPAPRKPQRAPQGGLFD
jgi:exodeoxyribonuclease VII large subunit